MLFTVMTKLHCPFGLTMRIKSVEYVKDYKLKLLFKCNETKIVDLEKMIKELSGIFSPLKNIDYFKQVALDDCQLSICWPNGADICPDVLYSMGKGIPKQDIKSPARRRTGKKAQYKRKTGHAMTKKTSDVIG
jgi:hypothetical protein